MSFWTFRAGNRRIAAMNRLNGSGNLVSFDTALSGRREGLSKHLTRTTLLIRARKRHEI